MKEFRFVNAKDLKTIEDYATCLLTGLMTIKTLYAFQSEAFKKGILDEDEMETGKTICWEIERLLSLYQTQLKNVLDRTELKEEEILESFKALVPDVKVPRKKKDDKGKKIHV